MTRPAVDGTATGRPALPTARVQSLRVYPVKGCTGTDVDGMDIGARGPAHDREFLIIRPDGRFITQRQHPRLALIQPSLEAIDTGELHLSRPYAEPVRIPIRTSAPVREVTVWRWDGHGIDQGDEVANWLSSFLGAPVRLVRFPDDEHRPTGVGGGEVGYADGYPLLVTSTASLADLNSRMEQPIPMDRFRPNVVVDGWPEPWTEDEVATLHLGDAVEVDLVRPCARCVVTTVDQRTAERGHEPLRTLAKFRNQELGLIFGQNGIPRTTGRVGVGDSIRAARRAQIPHEHSVPA